MLTDDASNCAAQLDHVVSLVCTEVVHYNTFDPCCSSAIPIFAQEVCWLFQSSKQRRGGGGGWENQCGAMNESLRANLIFPVIKVLFIAAPILNFCELLKEQSYMLYRTIKYNLQGYNFLNHELTNCSDVLDRGQVSSKFSHNLSAFWGGGFVLTYCTYVPTGHRLDWHVQQAIKHKDLWTE